MAEVEQGRAGERAEAARLLVFGHEALLLLGGRRGRPSLERRNVKTGGEKR